MPLRAAFVGVWRGWYTFPDLKTGRDVAVVDDIGELF